MPLTGSGPKSKRLLVNFPLHRGQTIDLILSTVSLRDDSSALT